MPAEWIDFRELRRSARIEQVLRAYAIDLKVKGDRATGVCPLPSHDGQRKSASFSVHLTKGLFNCFSCRRGGNTIDLVALLERLDPKSPTDVRKAALKLASICGVTAEANACVERKSANVNIPDGQFEAPTESCSVATTESKTVLVNPPLDFELQKLDPSHPYLKGRGLTAETIGHFGLGYCARGMLARRIAIPLHDSEGQLIGYAGRLVDDALIDADHPKYLFPGERTKDGVRRVFAKSKFLYNGARLTTAGRRLVVVEGFPSVWWLWQHGITDVVALMGCDCSEEQADLIVRLVDARGEVIAFLDADPAGMRGTEKFFLQVGSHRAVRYVRMHEPRQPTEFAADKLKSLFTDFG